MSWGLSAHLMENPDARPVRRVRCPKCKCVLEEPSAPVYQCGGCGTTLRAKIRTANTGDVARSGLPPQGQSRHLDSTDVASTSRSSTPTSLDATSSSRHQHHRATDTTSRHGSGDLVSGRRHGGSGDVASTSSTPTAPSGSRQGIDMTGRREPGDPVSARNRVSEQVALIEKRGHDHQSAADQEDVHGNSEPRDAAGGAAERRASSPAGVSVQLPRESKYASSELLQDDAEKGMRRQAEAPDAARKKHSGEAAVQPQYHNRQELAPKSAPAPAAKSEGDVLVKEDDAAAAQAAAGGKAVSPSRKNELPAENLGPLRKKILKTVDELKGDLSELFSKSPELNPTPRTRPPRLPKQEQEGHVSRAAVARARRHAAVGHRGSPARAVKPGRVAAPPPPPRGLPSRRYRQCRADPCCHAAQLPRPCHHGCCRHHGKPECSSCRGHCCRPRTQEPSAPPRNRPPAAAKEAGNKRRLPPRNHCRPVLKGAPFIVCSSCFKLVQVPADFAVPISTKAVRKLRCGACSTVLSYSYRDPARKKAYYDREDSMDQLSTDGSELQQGGNGCADPFAPFVDGFGLSSYSTEDEQQLHVSRNTSFGTMDGGARGGVGRLHKLMGYGSASELLRHSPDLYESFSERTTPSVRNYDRKGKGVCVDDNDHDYDVDDSDEEDGGVFNRSAARGFGWALPPGMLGKGIPAPGAIRIK